MLERKRGYAAQLPTDLDPALRAEPGAEPESWESAVAVEGHFVKSKANRRTAPTTGTCMLLPIWRSISRRFLFMICTAKEQDARSEPPGRISKGKTKSQLYNRSGSLERAALQASRRIQ